MKEIAVTRYRKKPVEVEAWQVGSDEPMPEWAASYLAVYPHFDERYSGLWLVRYPSGYIELNTNYQFEQTYEVME